MNLFGFLRHCPQHSFRKIISCEISRKLSFWKSENSTPKVSDSLKMRLIYPFAVSNKFKHKETVCCILIWLSCFEILLLISLYIFVANFSFTWILIIAFSKTFLGWWFKVAFVIVFKKLKVLSSSSTLLDTPDITQSCWGEWTMIEW